MSNKDQQIRTVRRIVSTCSDSIDERFAKMTSWRRCVLPWLVVAFLLLFVCHTVLRVMYILDIRAVFAMIAVVPIWICSLFCCLAADTYGSVSEVRN